MPHSEGLPPEINSSNMLNGPGPLSITYACMQWKTLIQEVQNLKSSFNQILRCLMDNWSGPAAIQVSNAATPFQNWLNYLHTKVDTTETEIRSIMYAVHNARHGVVDPELIDANRAQALVLSSDNELGQNTAAIAALEEEYAEYWDQDGMVMERYRDAVRFALSRLTPWTPPPPIATNTGLVQPVPRVAGS
ncbi:PPE family protein [Mycobacterium haemophilum]|uniref:PPE family protein n=1 Tax=Mycobacterium haemophilum TaxID=29311 RepID=UPI0006428055|nr:PPE family protein [Mycobacterium haemophilum]KLO25640.1 hypothetical protein ABH39_19455 [Mycobacterium haemophilum]